MALASTCPKAAPAKSARTLVRNAVAQLELLGSLRPEVIESELKGLLPGTANRVTIARMAQVITAVVNRPASTKPTTQPLRKRARPVAPPPAFAGQAKEARADLVKQMKVIPAGALLLKLNCSRQALSKAVRAHRLFAVDVGTDRLYPAFYADPDLDRRQLERVAQELGELPGWSKWQFFTTPKASLGGVTPLVALKEGKYTEARRAAIGFLDR